MTRSDGVGDGGGGGRVVGVVVGGVVGGCVQVNREEKALVVVMMIVHSSLVPELFNSIGIHRTADIIFIDKGPYTYYVITLWGGGRHVSHNDNDNVLMLKN